jgi:hypothetical protein
VHRLLTPLRPWPGDDFVDAIGQTLGRCDLMIAIIGLHG